MTSDRPDDDDIIGFLARVLDIETLKSITDQVQAARDQMIDAEVDRLDDVLDAILGPAPASEPAPPSCWLCRGRTGVYRYSAGRETGGPWTCRTCGEVVNDLVADELRDDQ